MGDHEKNEHENESMTTQEAGQMGGARERELVQEGHEMEAEQAGAGTRSDEFGERAGKDEEEAYDADAD